MYSLRAILQRLLLSGGAKPLWFGVSMVPAVYLLVAAFADQLGPNPAEALIRSTGDWALRGLCLVLAITPLRTVAGIPVLARFRRMAGLFVYFYASLHLVSYAWLDQGFDVEALADDIAKRPFILVGFLAWLVLTLLALTSWNRVIRMMGGLAWRRLHSMVHLIGFLGILHFFWIRAGKHNFLEVGIYALVLGILMAWRVRQRWLRSLVGQGGLAGADRGSRRSA